MIRFQTLLYFATLLSIGVSHVTLEERNTENDRVSFDVIASRSMDIPPTVEVTLNGVKDGLELEHYRMNDVSAVGCNYLGYLRSKPSSSVAVTGCLNKPGDRMDVTMISENSIDQMYTVDFDRNAEIIKSPFEEGALSRAIKVPKMSLADRNYDDQKGDEIFDDDEEKLVRAAKRISIPSHLKAVIKFGYEDGLNSEIEDFDSWIAGVFTHTQAHFRHAASLGTTIDFEVQGSAVHQEGSTWTADDNITDARIATNSLGLDGVDVMSWWCNSGGGGVLGIAYVGSLCRSYNTNLNEKQSNAARSGLLLAHELGHNFGMYHDFDEKHGGSNGPCNGKGIMSYGSNRPNKWSTCSRSDWEQHYSGRKWGEGCLEDISVHCSTYNDCPVDFPYCNNGFCSPVPPRHCLPHEQCEAEDCCALWTSCNTCPNGYVRNSKECRWKGSYRCNKAAPPSGKVIIGPSDVGGTCPSPTYKYWKYCCCGAGCCWNKCTSNSPPQDCLSGVPGAIWMYNTQLGYYQAFKEDVPPPPPGHCLPHQRCNAGDCCSRGSSCKTCPNGYVKNTQECRWKGLYRCNQA